MARPAYSPRGRRAAAEVAAARLSRRILGGIAPEGGTPRQRAVVKGWPWLMDGVILDWLEHRDLGRPEVEGRLMDALRAAA